MERLKFVLISVLVLVFVLVTPARTQTTPQIQLPYNLNVALCVNDWDRALNIVQEMLSSSSIGADARSQLTSLSTQLEAYQARSLQVDQSDACEAAIAAGQGGNVNSIGSSSGCVLGNMAADGRCFSNPSAAKRHSRSVEEGDRPASERSQ